MSELKCPKCGSRRIDQYRMPSGAIWCSDCGFRVEQKERGNPFIVEPPKPAPVQSGKNCRECYYGYCSFCKPDPVPSAGELAVFVHDRFYFGNPCDTRKAILAPLAEGGKHG